MAIEQNFRIAGTGRALPERSVEAEEIDERSGMPYGWTRSRVGVVKRYECRPPETLLSIGSMAIRHALEKSGLQWSDIDLILDCSTSKIRPIPCNAAHLQAEFGSEASGIPCFDIESTCLGFIVALHVANSLFTTNLYRNILIVAMESCLKAADWSNPESAALLGDGAAAVILRHETTGSPLLFAQETYSDYLGFCKVDGGGHLVPSYDFTEDNRGAFLFHMDGPGIFRVASLKLPEMVNRLVTQWLEYRPGLDRDLQMIPHQASPRALSIMRRLLGVPASRFHVGVEGLGNMAAASIPWLLDSLLEKKTLSSGDPLLLLGTSAGYSQAALVFTL